MTAKIMRFIYFLIVLSINVLGVEQIPFLQDEYDPENWPKVHLKLSQAGTLKNVFDSGLRPYRFPGLENSTLEVKHKRLVTHFALGKVLPQINAEWLNIKMFNDGEMSQIEGATPQLSLQEARTEMLKWLPYGTRPTEDLDEYLKAVEADPLDFDDPFRGLPDGCDVGWKEPGWMTLGGGPQCGFWFRKTFSKAQPLKLYFIFSWGLNRRSKDAKSYRIPIPPPAGYEHVSMKAPEKFGPDSGADVNRSKGLPITGDRTPEEYEKQWREANDKTRAPRLKTSVVEPKPKLPETSKIFAWLFGISGVLTAFLVWRWGRSSKEGHKRF